MSEPHRGCHAVGRDEVSLADDVCVYELPNALGHLIGHEPEIERRLRLGGDGVCGLVTYCADSHPPHVDRRQHDPFSKRSVSRFRCGQPKRATQRRIDRGNGHDRPALARGDRLHITVKTGDPDATIVVAHAGDEARDHRAWIGSPVAVMSAVQCSRWTVDGHIEPGHSANSELHLLLSALMIGAIAEEPRVSFESSTVTLEHLLEVR